MGYSKNQTKIILFAELIENKFQLYFKSSQETKILLDNIKVFGPMPCSFLTPKSIPFEMLLELKIMPKLISYDCS